MTELTAREFERELTALGWRAGFRNLALLVAGASLAAALLELFLLPQTTLTAIAFFLTLSLPLAVLYFFLDYLRERRLREINAALPAALMQIASFPRRASIERMIDSIASSDYGALSEEFAVAHRQIIAGASVKHALERVCERSPSPLLQRSTALLLEAFESGADLAPAFKEIAEDAFELQALVKESAAANALQKYTLLVGGAIIVPVILGMLLNVVSSLGAVGMADEGASAGEAALFSATSPAARAALTQAVVVGTQVYLIAFAGLASVFIASLEGARRKAILYFVLMAPLALLLFNLVQSITII